LISKRLAGSTIVQFFNKNKMKKISVLVLTVFLNLAFFSCTPQALSNNDTAAEEIEASGGEEQTSDEEEDPSDTNS